MIKYSREILEPIVAISDSYSEIIRRLGANPNSGGVQQHLRKRIKFYELSVKHFSPRNTIAGRVTGNKIRKKIEDIFVKIHGDKKERTRRLRRAMLKTNFEYKCNECGVFEWNGKPLLLEIHHKDEDCMNNVKNNLEFVCPNCHSQLTFPGKGNKKDMI
jgi:predicted RNA-binding Zn-ribbon protein involved in translation (DUF1610 family)